MIKNKTAKMVGAAMAAALMFGTVAPITVNANGLEGTNVKLENDYNVEQYNYARQEVGFAIELLDYSDLTNVENYDAMMAYASSARERLESIESNDNVEALLSMVYDEIFPSAEVALRLMNDMRCLQEASEETKEAWIDALNEAIIYARENSLVNETTLRAATDVLHAEAGVVVEESKSQEDDYNVEQYNYAQQEVGFAIELLDNADLTNVENYDAMMAYASSAKERLESIESNDNVDALYSMICDEIYPSAEVALRLMNDMRCLQEASEETKEAWIDALNEAIIYARENSSVNETTLRAATDVLHTEAGVNK